MLFNKKKRLNNRINRLVKKIDSLDALINSASNLRFEVREQVVQLRLQRARLGGERE